jgi:hypothetical protein
MILNMFLASLCSSSGVQLYIYSIWHRQTLCTSWQRTECDDARYCKCTIVLLKMSTAMLETCWGSWCNIIIEEIKLCVKLVINSSLFLSCTLYLIFSVNLCNLFGSRKLSCPIMCFSVTSNMTFLININFS